MELSLPNPRIHTIGYSGIKMNQFIDLLTKNGIEVICDVRSVPYSGARPEFSRRQFKSELNKHGVRYKFMGHLLGARPEDERCYQGTTAKYKLIARSAFFAEGKKRLEDGVTKTQIALVCSEADPIECHRAILVCRHLDILKSDIRHIHGDGSLETQSELEDRMLDLYSDLPPKMLRDDKAAKAVLPEIYEKVASGIEFRIPVVDRIAGDVS